MCFQICSNCFIVVTFYELIFFVTIWKAYSMKRTKNQYIFQNFKKTHELCTFTSESTKQEWIVINFGILSDH